MTEMMTKEEILEMARMMGFEHWLDEEPNGRGWYTCLLTGKKFRGAQAKAMLEEQRRAMEERVSEIQIEEEKMETAEQIALEIEEQAEAAGDGQPEEQMAKPEQVEVVDLSQGDQYRYTQRLADHIAINRISGKPVKTVTIECIDCGAPRIIKVQDAFQVKRCPECQRKYRNRKRAERRRQKRLEER